MIFTLIISLLTCLGIIATSILKPSIKIKKFTLNLYWVIALVGALIILCSSTLSFKEFFEGLTSDSGINPLQILILFISMTIISIFLDEMGFFSFMANWVLRHTKDKQMKIFVAFYFLVAVLTMFTSNDIIILTLTPFIIFFCKNAKISPIPYLVSEFVCANTWSMMFVIGNPTNIYLSQSYGIDFLEYFKVMWLPTLVAGILEFAILLLLFRKKLQEPIAHIETKETIKNKPLTIIGLSVLFVCTVFLIISSYIDMPMYLISACSLVTLTIAVLLCSLIQKNKPVELGKSYLRGPYELIPFVLSMFVLVLSLDKYDVTKSICEFFGNDHTTIIYGYVSLASANLLNNIPMSVTFSSIISFLPMENSLAAIYASIAGSNIGAFLTPIGALAGIMWMGILKNHGVKYTFLDFMKYGFIIGIPVMTVTLLMQLVVI